jgi:hypothetical protein
MLTYKHFNWPNYFNDYIRLNDNIAQYFRPNGIIVIRDVYKLLMY